MGKKLWRISLISLMCICLTGCWSRKELTDLAIVSATGINWKDNRWELTYQLVTPAEAASGATGSSSGSGPPISVISVQAKSLREALAKNDFENTRKLHLGNNRVVVFSENAARHGINNLMDAYLRNPQSRETINMFITRDDPRTIVSQLMYLEKNTGEGIHKLIEKETKSLSTLPKVNVFNMAIMLAGPAKCAIAPEIVLAGKGEAASKQQLESTTTLSKLKLGELAILKAGKLKGWLTQDEALGIAFIRNKLKATTFSFDCPEERTKAKSTFEVTASTTKLKLHRQDDQYVVTAKIKVKGTITESSCELDATSAELISKVEKEIEDEIMNYIQKGWNAVRGMKADVLEFADMFHRKYPAEWEKEKDNWESVFSEKIEFKPTLKVTVERVGLTNHSFQETIKE
ncbi:Ger(x)C family spore germination protein [Paenibacillus puldeungensis]|uniref:Ger(X)C family spore germination protein n=1 Tax=Paenibacillus puldeungensis TaxID=696536 RepID=A0ABW3S1K2_9BACL